MLKEELSLGEETRSRQGGLEGWREGGWEGDGKRGGNCSAVHNALPSPVQDTCFSL